MKIHHKTKPEDKNDAIINIRMPKQMKEQIKFKLASWNLSAIMRKHFQELLDKKDNEDKCYCTLCYKKKTFKECSFVVLRNKNDTTVYTICKECINGSYKDVKDFDDEESKEFLITTLCLIEFAKSNEHPEHLEEWYKMASERPTMCSIEKGVVFFNKDFQKMADKNVEDYKNTKARISTPT